MTRIVGENVSETTESARAIIERFTVLAFRGRQPETEFLDRLTGFFESHRRSGRSFEEALIESLSIVLASPGFLYLSETNGPSEPNEIMPIELACRLSYFLWSAPPDEELLTLARSGELTQPEVLTRQVDRMISSEKS